jgi:hypothetical protein
MSREPPVPVASPDDRCVTVGALGEGGMGEVPRVYDRVLGRVLAMKVTRRQIAAPPPGARPLPP